MSGTDDDRDSGAGEPAEERPTGALRMGRPFGVPVYVTPSWFLIAALITWLFGGQIDAVLPGLGGARYLVSLFFAVAFYGSVLIHELAHTVLALRFKLPVLRIQLQFFGGVSEITKEADSAGREFWLAFAGPLLSLVLGGVFLGVMQFVTPATVPGVLVTSLMLSNFVVAAFNLLPGLPLDGGRMLRAVVWKLTGRPMTGTVAAAWAGRALAIAVLIVMPTWSATQNQDQGTGALLTDAVLGAVLAAIIWNGAGSSLRTARLRERLPELSATALTRPAVSVTADTPLAEALRRLEVAEALGIIVTDSAGTPIALVRERAVRAIPEHRRPWMQVSEVSVPLVPGSYVDSSLAGEDLLDTLRAAPAAEYLVRDAEGNPLGVLAAVDVERAFARAMSGQDPILVGGPSART
ncbi:site-2 protease family protein [Streptacidiphilus rugosus]|uniref:site-2 protease family protein n=1 Tax=Streptacidiphilus rugosus TaxID=405783 RepID=UPI0007C7953A|nr:site-2 protease family protein [Streptacidiphilus rugosus]